MKNTTVCFLGLFLLFSIKNHAQEEQNRVITTSVPFLLIAADARAAALGDQGVASSPDAFSQQWNPAKYAFATSENGVGFAYTPYLRELVSDIDLGTITYFNKISDRGAFAASIRYFGLGGIELRQDLLQEPREVQPNEFAIDLSYALKLSDEFSMAVTGRFINSNLKIPGIDGDASAANTFGVDVSAFYQSQTLTFTDFDGRWRGGLNISNIGPKLKYDDAGQENFIPTNFRIGGGFDFILDPSNKISTQVEFSKLLVPTPQDFDNDGDIDFDDAQEYNEISSFGAIFSSWNDAPDGMSEELKEVTWALGAEYWYEDSFAFRLGYFSEAEDKGFRKFMALGAGFKYTAISLDVSYLFSTSRVQNPLEGTLRFGLTFNFGGESAG
ncbi:MAG TPA: type IX secretion system outer membrane channel protein PorV [Salinimicrobium sp.]|nr:type IX secretion system outer membrane channel protein PorV [Salinimicrobium sp.]